MSAPATVYLDCVPIRAETNEMDTFMEAFEQLVKDWRNTDLLELISVDAGMVSLEHATRVDQAGFGYLMAIKGPQPELHAQLHRLLGPSVSGKPDAQTVEQYRGNTVTYSIWRTREIAGWLQWSHLRQGIRIERRVTSENPSEDDLVEQRYYVSNLPWNRLAHEQWIDTVRCHWRVENNAHWVLDVILEEDDLRSSRELARRKRKAA